MQNISFSIIAASDKNKEKEGWLDSFTHVS